MAIHIMTVNAELVTHLYTVLLKLFWWENNHRERCLGIGCYIFSSRTMEKLRNVRPTLFTAESLRMLRIDSVVSLRDWLTSAGEVLESFGDLHNESSTLYGWSSSLFDSSCSLSGISTESVFLKRTDVLLDEAELSRPFTGVDKTLL